MTILVQNIVTTKIKMCRAFFKEDDRRRIVNWNEISVQKLRIPTTKTPFLAVRATQPDLLEPHRRLRLRRRRGPRLPEPGLQRPPLGHRRVGERPHRAHRQGNGLRYRFLQVRCYLHATLLSGDLKSEEMKKTCDYLIALKASYSCFWLGWSRTLKVDVNFVS